MPPWRGPPDQVGTSGHTALMLAAEAGNIEMAQALLDAGADVDRPHPGSGIYTALRGWTPLVFAVRGGRVKITRALLERGADVDRGIVPGRRVIHFCAGRQAERLRSLLVEAGALPIPGVE